MMVDSSDTLLYNLIKSREWDEVRKFLSLGARTDSGDSNSSSSYNDNDFMKNIFFQNDGGTTLMDAFWEQAPDDIITTFIEKGGKALVMTVKDVFEETALHFACRRNATVKIVELLCEVGGQDLIVMKDRHGDTALEYATKYNASDGLKHYLRGEITSKFCKDLRSKPNALTLLTLESFVKAQGIDALFRTALDDDASIGTPIPIQLMADSIPSVDIIRYLLDEGPVHFGEAEYKDKYPTIRSDWNGLLRRAILPGTKGDVGKLWYLVNMEYWEAVRIFMTIEGIPSPTRMKHLFYKGGEEADTSLHAAIKTHSIPLDVFDLLIYIGGRELVLIRNRDHKTAYEVACESGAGPEVIERLKTLSNDELLLFLGKYRILDTNAIHQSDTSVVMKGQCAATKRDVAVKFIANYEHYEKELGHRERVKRHQNNEHALCVVPIIDSFDGKKDVDYDMPDAAKFDQSMKFIQSFDGKNTKVKLSDYKYAIVMGLADRSLDAIYREEKPNKNMCRGSLEDVLMRMEMLNKAGLCHGDLKTRNCVRIKGRIYIIDLDGASEFPQDKKEDANVNTYHANSYVGAKFSSGIVAPEMIHRFQGEAWETEVAAYKKYFDELKDQDGLEDHWKKVQPMCRKRYAYAVKTFLTTRGGTKRSHTGELYTPVIVKDMDKLPYDLVEASQAIDLWSFGVMLYKFETGQDLFNIDQQKDDLQSFEDMEKLACWDDEKKNDAIQKVKDPKAHDLLGKLLSKEKVNRGTITEALKHPYITGAELVNPDTMIHQNLKLPPIEVGEKQCLANGILIDLPDKVDRSVAEGTFELLFEAARYGVGEITQAKGMLIVIGCLDDFKKIGYWDKGMNTFEGTRIDVREWKSFKERILPCFVKDGAFCIDGETGFIVSDSFFIDLSTRNADKNGGTGHRNASAAGEEGFLAIKCSEDSCATDGRGKKKLKVFPGTKVPTMVPVKPENMI